MLEAHVTTARAGQPDSIDRLWAGDVLSLGPLEIHIEAIEPASMVARLEPATTLGPMILAPGDALTFAAESGQLVASVTLMTIQEAPQC